MGLDVRLRDTVFALMGAHARVTAELGREMEQECGIALSWVEVLFMLSHAPGRRLRMHELATACLISKGGLTRLVDRIEAAGLVAREAIPSDRRSFNVALTESGSSMLERATVVLENGVERHVGRLVLDFELDPFLNALRRIASDGGSGAAPYAIQK